MGLLTKTLANDNFIVCNKQLAKNLGCETAIFIGILCSQYELIAKNNQLTNIDGVDYFYITGNTI